jgi:hypothetical protein
MADTNTKVRSKSGWFSMTHAERIEAIKAHPNLSYPKLAQKLGVASSSVSKFARRNGFVRKNEHINGGTNLRAEWLCAMRPQNFTQPACT